MKNILCIAAILIASTQTVMADQNDPIECNVIIYCSNPSGGSTCGLIGDVNSHDGKIEIVRNSTDMIYTASSALVENGFLVRLQARNIQGSYFLEDSSVMNLEKPRFSLSTGGTSLYCKLK